ncbi:MAG: phospholipase [Planctomycetia bacterium]|nr:phospholipase [Planctomycetia bacterium]
MAVTASALRELHRIHRQLTDLRERKERGPKQIRAREANLARLADELTKLQADHKAARVRSDQKQLLLKSGEDKVESLKVKLNAAASNREYQVLKDQIAADQMAGSVLADEILEAMEKIDELAAQIAEQQKKIAVSKEELAKAQQSVLEQAELLETDLKRLEAQLREAEAALPTDFRENYQRVVNSKQDDAMAEVQGDFCGGCYQQLTPNSMAELSMSVAIFCRNCGRLIYLPEDRTPSQNR